MPQTSSSGVPVTGLVEFVREDRSRILAAWRAKTRRLPNPSGASLGDHAGPVLEWLASRLEDDARGRVAPQELLDHESFSAPRVIAELALLTETIDELLPSSALGDTRGALHRVIDDAIAHSLARDGDENERLRKRLRMATDVTLVGSWAVAPDGRGVDADTRPRELFGVADGATTLEALTSAIHVDDRERVRSGIGSMLDSGRPYVDECRVVRADGGSLRWIALAADAHQSLDGTSPRVLGIVHDVTDRRRTEEERLRVLEELSRAVHISEMFVGVLSHDLRTPLSAILAGAHLLGGELDRATVTRVVSRVVSSGQRMGRMIDQLLDFTRARLGEGIPLAREGVDIAQLASEAVEEGKATTPGALLRLTSRGDPAGAWDRDRIWQILSNLVGNAVQHGDRAASVDIDVDGTDGERVVVSIENQGAIPAVLLPVIFNPFRGTVEKRGKPSGLGLGLYVARQIALAHGGDLKVKSSGSTTTFVLTLPRSGMGESTPTQDLLREEEMVALERLAAPPSTTAVTAKLFGATPLRERSPVEYASIAGHYALLLDTALHRQAYRGQGEGLASDLRALAERLGELGASPRELTEVHAHALRHAAKGVTVQKTQALLSEGRLIALELMGNLASYYRRRSRGAAWPTAGKER